MRERDPTVQISTKEREEVVLTEKDVSSVVEEVVRIMFRVLSPRIIAITTSSLLNATAPDGIFRNLLDDFNVMLCDEASQVPGLIFAAVISRFPQTRHIYVGDLHQLEPYVQCSRRVNTVHFRARSVTKVLTRARAVSMTALVTTFRTHSMLNSLPNSVICEQTLISGTRVEFRRLLLNVMGFPLACLPFMFVNVAGTSHRPLSRSHLNEEEADVCDSLARRLLSLGVQATGMCVITFYKEQNRCSPPPLRDLGVSLAFVDPIQGREMDVVIVLTTKTVFATEAGEFLDDHHRMTVALTRCRHGQFLPGHVASLRTLPGWCAVLHWTEQHLCVVQASYLPSFSLSPL